jgi:membrane-associated phospholipid phosphatase
MRSVARVASAGTFLCLLTAPARADAPPALVPAADVDHLRYDVPADLSFTLLGATAWGISEYRKADLAPAACIWCAPNAFDTAARDALKWSNTDAADALSYVTGYALAPIVAIAGDALVAWRDGRARDAAVDTLLIAEATVVALDVDQATKFIAGRERPFVHALAPADKARTAQPSDNNVSFFSGHSTLAFSLATASATVATLRGYRNARWLWPAGLLVAALTGYLRIAADRHYLSDVLVGAAVGSLSGFAVPWLFHQRAEGKAAVPVATASPMPGGGTVRLTWIW